MKPTRGAVTIIAALFLSSNAMAADINVRIVNLTNGIWYTPFLIAAHTDDSWIFAPGMPASGSLQAMAEGGSLDNVVKVTNFVTDISKEATEASRDMRRKYFGEKLPASTRVQVVGLIEPQLLIEIEAIAVLPD